MGQDVSLSLFLSACLSVSSGRPLNVKLPVEGGHRHVQTRHSQDLKMRDSV